MKFNCSVLASMVVLSSLVSLDVQARGLSIINCSKDYAKTQTALTITYRLPLNDSGNVDGLFHYEYTYNSCFPVDDTLNGFVTGSASDDFNLVNGFYNFEFYGEKKTLEILDSKGIFDLGGFDEMNCEAHVT